MERTAPERPALPWIALERPARERPALERTAPERPAPGRNALESPTTTALILAGFTTMGCIPSWAPLLAPLSDEGGGCAPDRRALAPAVLDPKWLRINLDCALAKSG